MTNIGIYKITSPSGKVYIGQSWNLKQRIRMYRQQHAKKQVKLYASLVKYGWENHQFEVLLYLKEDTTQDWMNYWETFFWKYFKDEEKCEMMNVREPGSKGRLSEETKVKMSHSQKGKVIRMESIEKMRLTKMNISDETRKNISESQKKLWCDPAHRLKQSLAHKGYKASEETRKKLSELRRGHKHPSAKPVLKFSIEGVFIKEYSYIKQAAIEIGKSYNRISECCSGKRESAYGFVWKYKTEN